MTSLSYPAIDRTEDPGAETSEGWICTYTGGWIQPLSANPDDVRIEDIAHSLSNQSRFTGHVKDFYSTAQHSVLVSSIVPIEDALWGLLHDASETYLADIASPVKRQPGFGEAYKTVELALEEVIAEHFGLPWPMPDTIKPADRAVLRAEQRDLMPNDPLDGDIYEPEIVAWQPLEAELMFLARYNTLTGSDLPLPAKPKRSLWDTLWEQRGRS